MRKTRVVLAAAVVLSGCYAEGESFLIARGETQRYASMRACEAVAMARYPDGGPVYSGFECRSMILGSVRSTVRYHNGVRDDEPQ